MEEPSDMREWKSSKGKEKEYHGGGYGTTESSYRTTSASLGGKTGLDGVVDAVKLVFCSTFMLPSI